MSWHRHVRPSNTPQNGQASVQMPGHFAFANRPMHRKIRSRTWQSQAMAFGRGNRGHHRGHGIADMASRTWHRGHGSAMSLRSNAVMSTIWMDYRDVIGPETKPVDFCEHIGEYFPAQPHHERCGHKTVPATPAFP